MRFFTPIGLGHITDLLRHTEITLQDVTNSKYKLALFVENQKLELVKDGNRTWKPVGWTPTTTSSQFQLVSRVACLVANSGCSLWGDQSFIFDAVCPLLPLSSSSSTSPLPRNVLRALLLLPAYLFSCPPLPTLALGALLDTPGPSSCLLPPLSPSLRTLCLHRSPSLLYPPPFPLSVRSTAPARPTPASRCRKSLFFASRSPLGC